MLDRSFRGAALTWRKSSASDSAEGNCVEVAVEGRSVLVRDSRKPAGGMLVLGSPEWRTLLRRIVDGELDGR
ncbi:DUF397 domain-containing protein [Actinomadura adrarensis]|uniref:DUF397 domain-containing protein n=1 Tax=Actinomadura adrarensis TaxID=1819600 RepID=A0ABW3CPS3_9ACTN